MFLGFGVISAMRRFRIMNTAFILFLFGKFAKPGTPVYFITGIGADP